MNYVNVNLVSFKNEHRRQREWRKFYIVKNLSDFCTFNARLWSGLIMEEESANWNFANIFCPDVNKYGWVLAGTWQRFDIDPNSLMCT